LARFAKIGFEPCKSFNLSKLHPAAQRALTNLPQTALATINANQKSLGAMVDGLGLPRFQGQVDRGHAMTTRMSIDELTHQDQASIHGAAKGGGC
jgi:hypothetical protein